MNISIVSIHTATATTTLATIMIVLISLFTLSTHTHGFTVLSSIPIKNFHAASHSSHSYSRSSYSSSSYSSSYSSCSSPTSIISSSSTVLHLVPSQGCQLAAASAAALAKQKQMLDEENNSNNSNTNTSNTNSNNNGNKSNMKHLSPSDATREFVSRLFHLPSPFNNHNHGHGQESMIEFKIPGITNTNTNTNTSSNTNAMKPENDINNNKLDNTHTTKKDDVVLYPIVGFQYVKLKDGSVRGIPTCNAVAEKAVCNIDAAHMSHVQPTIGYYSKCCVLGNVYSDDHDEYCGEQRWREWEKVVTRKKDDNDEEEMMMTVFNDDGGNGGSGTPHPSEMI